MTSSVARAYIFDRRQRFFAIENAVMAICVIAVRTDQGPEFTSKILDQWANQHGITPLLIQPGKPSHNAYIESFNGKLRDECLNEHWFFILRDAKKIIATRRRYYNEQRSHSSIGFLTPAEFAVNQRQHTIDFLEHKVNE